MIIETTLSFCHWLCYCHTMLNTTGKQLYFILRAWGGGGGGAGKWGTAAKPLADVLKNSYNKEIVLSTIIIITIVQRIVIILKEIFQCQTSVPWIIIHLKRFVLWIRLVFIHVIGYGFWRGKHNIFGYPLCICMVPYNLALLLYLNSQEILAWWIYITIYLEYKCWRNRTVAYYPVHSVKVTWAICSKSLHDPRYMY